MSLSLFLPLYHFYGLFTVYFLYEEVCQLDHMIREKRLPVNSFLITILSLSLVFFMIIVSKQCKNVIFYQFRTYKKRLAHLLQLSKTGRIGTTATTARKMQFYSSHCPESVSPVKCKNKFQKKFSSFYLKFFLSEMLPSLL